jgi:hypothetical protein
LFDVCKKESRLRAADGVLLPAWASEIADQAGELTGTVEEPRPRREGGGQAF